MLRFGFILCCLQSFYLIKQIYGHGYLADPPARSSAWIFDKDFDKCCRYYNHAEMSCGGMHHQWSINGGKCSVCGEAYDLKNKLLDVGGKMYLGKIVRTYTEGATIPVKVILTANHRGIFEFRVCSIDNDPNKEATQECLDLNLLNIDQNLTFARSDQQLRQFPIIPTATTVLLNVTLPPTLVCKHCVFQWKYRTGNSWGSQNGRNCLGCGKANEEFYGCADIAIKSINEPVDNETSQESTEPSVATSSSTEPSVATSSTTEPSTTTKSIAVHRKCKSALTFSKTFDLSSIVSRYCDAICPENCASDKASGNEIVYNACVTTCEKLCICE